MSRLWMILAALLLIGQVSGVGALAVEIACVDHCEDEGEDECPADGGRTDCSPGCADCACCAHPRSLVGPGVATFVLPPAVIARPDDHELAPPAREPIEILHVPKPRA